MYVTLWADAVETTRSSTREKGEADSEVAERRSGMLQRRMSRKFSGERGQVDGTGQSSSTQGGRKNGRGRKKGGGCGRRRVVDERESGEGRAAR